MLSSRQNNPSSPLKNFYLAQLANTNNPFQVEAILNTLALIGQEEQGSENSEPEEQA